MRSLNSASYSRRQFLERAVRSTAGFFLISDLPPWLGKIHNRSYVERSFYSMGAVATICAYGGSRGHLQHTLTKVIEEFQRVDGLLSVYQTGSEVSNINASAGEKEVAVGCEILEVLEAARRFNILTQRAFDVTIEPLMRLWGFRKVTPHIDHMPSDAEIRATLGRIGIHQIETDVQRKTVGLKNPGTRLDFGGIAVGYAVDRAVAIMKVEGIESAFINHSGDAYALGSPEGSDGWRIAIPDPIDRRKILTTSEIRDRAISTSANYEKYVTIDTARYGHILDPATGYPSDAMLSATLSAHSALEADALSTGCYAMGVEKAAAVIRALPGAGLLSVECDEEKTNVQTHGTGF